MAAIQATWGDRWVFIATLPIALYSLVWFGSYCEALIFRLYFFLSLMLWRNPCLHNSHVFLEKGTRGVQQTYFKADSSINATGINHPANCHFVEYEYITIASTRTGNSAALHCQPVMRNVSIKKNKRLL
jgi:hypothetical protein